MKRKGLLVLIPALLLCLLFIQSAFFGAGEDTGVPKMTVCERQSDTVIGFTLKSKYPDLKVEQLVVRVSGETNLLTISALSNVKADKDFIITVSSHLALDANYEVGAISGDKTNFIESMIGDAVWNNIYSDKPLGCNVEKGAYVFRVFSARAKKVVLCLFDKPYQFSNSYLVTEEIRKGNPKYKGETQYDMVKDKDGVWEYTLKGKLTGKLYGYRVTGPKGKGENFHPEFIVADPYSKAVATYQVTPQHQLTVIIDASNYKWVSKQKYAPVKRREAIVYECHVRDMTMLSPDNKKKGTYEGLVEDAKTGGLNYIKDLGVNIVELMPTQEFDEIEKTYNNNTYARNHWGYMTSCFFAPESYYYEPSTKADTWIGVSGGQINAYKKMVDVFHQNGIGVMMDVVYNHVSQYDLNSYKFIDQKYYFWIDANGGMDSKSGCGNDLKTDRPMCRRMIVDSTRYWVDEYHVDGFRFDLGTIIDWKTWEVLRDKCRALNPECHITAEPWMGGRGEPRDGGGYALNDNANGFDKRDLGAWNDKVRILIRNSGNLVFGGASFSDLKTAVLVYPKLFKVNPADSFNYAESHDNNTLSDLIRLGNKEFKANDVIEPGKYLDACKLNDKSLKQNKIAALFLLTLQGPAMLSEGQEVARMKICYPPAGDCVFPPNSANWQKVDNNWFNITADGKTNKWTSDRPKVLPYMIDDNSWPMDNECNWINWKLKDENKALFDYYKGIISIRKQNSAFSTMDVTKIQIIEPKYPDGSGKPKSSIGYVYDKQFTKDKRSFAILVNGAWTNASFELPAGDWEVLADGDTANPKGLGKKVSGSVVLPEMTGMILAQ